MGSAITNFLSVIEARSLGTADIDKMAAAIDKQTASLDGLTKHADKVNSHPGFNDFANKIKQGLSDPIGAAESAIQSATSALGPFGQVVGGTVVILGSLAAAGFQAAKSLAEYGQQIENTGLRTGLTSKEVVQFGFAAKLVDQDVTVFERSMRGLTEAMADTSAKGEKARQALHDLGVVPRTLNGELKPTGEILLELSAALNRLPDVWARNQAGMDLFKRAWIEIGPSILKLSEGVKLANDNGFFGPSKAELDKWDEYDRKVTSAEAKLDIFWRKAKGILAEGLFPSQDLVELRRQKDAQERGIPYQFPIDQLNNLPTSSPRANPLLLLPGGGAALGTIDADRAAGNALLSSSRNRMDSTLEGLRLKTEDAKTKYEDAYKSIRTLSDVGAAAAQTQIDKVGALKDNYQRLEEQLKLLEKTEAKRIASLEKERELLRSGYGSNLEGFYKLGTGDQTVFILPEQIAAANGAGQRRGAPSLFGSASTLGLPVYNTDGTLHSEGVETRFPSNRFYSPAYSEAVQRSLSPPDLPQGIDPLGGAFVTPTSNRTISAGMSQEQLNARGSAFFSKLNADSSSKVAIANAEADAVARMVELRAGPGGELAAARLVASIREQSLQRELDLALKIAEAEKHRVDAARSFGSAGFDAALGGASGLRQFGTNLLMNQGRTIAGNAAAQLFGNVSPYLGSTNKLFQGTVFGQDPLKAATDANTVATIANTRAWMAFTARIAQSASGGGDGLYSSAGSTFSRFFGGGSTVPGGELSEDGVPIGRDPLSGVNGDFAGETSHPAGGFNFGKAFGVGSAVVGGGLGIYSGINTGGARGALTASASGVGAAGALLLAAGVSGPAAPILAGVGLALGLVTTLLGDPKKLRANEINRDAQSRSFSMPGGADYTVDANGNYIDYNASGHVRKVEVTNTIYAMDSRSLTDFLLENPGALSNGIANAISGGNAEDTMGLIQQRMAP